MPKYLFTSDQRISVLSDSIQKVAQHIVSGHDLSEITDKSDNNNATTLRSYYNLYAGTEVCEQAAKNPKYAIRNFVTKFQFPNVRTPESLNDCISEHTMLAPFRSTVILLDKMAHISSDGRSYITYDEILFYEFCNPAVYRTINVKYDAVIKDILKGREANIDLSDKIAATIEWKQYGRQIGELMAALFIASDAFKRGNRSINYSINSDAYKQDFDFINSILTYNLFWYPSDYRDFNKATKEYISYMDTVHTPYNVVEIDPQNEAENISVAPSVYDEYINLLIEHYNLVLTGAPGTGKTYLAKQIAAQMVGTCTWNKLSEEQMKHIRFIQFHPSYDYTDFVEGLRPEKEGDFARTDGDFKAFCKAAIKDAENPVPYIFIIDEINRGEISKIFGELFYSIEADYRGNETLVRTQYNNMVEESDVFYNGFYVPKNVYIIGTMNDIDRGVEAMDFAIRRRFAWREVTAEESANNMGIKGLAFEKMVALNKSLKECNLSEAFFIGGAYFRKVKGNNYDALWKYHLKGIVSEYFRGEPDANDKLATVEKAYKDAGKETKTPNDPTVIASEEIDG